MLNASQLSAFSRRLTEAYAGAMRPLSEETGLPQGAVDILMFLANNPGRDTAREVCACRGMKPGIVSLYVENLARQGYVERQSVPGDRRKCRLVCTERAEPVIRRGRALQERFARRLTEGIPPEELEACHRCFLTFEENLSALVREAGHRELIERKEE